MNSPWTVGAKIPELKESNLLAQGSHAKVYSISNQLVVRQLKNFRGTYPNFEFADYVQRLGYPAPALYEANKDKLVMQRLHGPTLLQSLIAQETSAAEGVEIIVQLLNQLHEIFPLPNSLAHGPVKDSDRILHMDVHPGTIIMVDSGPYLVSWEDSRFGPPELDLASTALVFALVACEPNELQKGSASMFRKFTRRVGTGYLPYLEQAAQIRQTEMDTTPEELALLGSAVAWAVEHLSEEEYEPAGELS